MNGPPIPVVVQVADLLTQWRLHEWLAANLPDHGWTIDSDLGMGPNNSRLVTVQFSNRSDAVRFKLSWI